MISWEDLFAKMDAGEELNIVSIRQQDVYDEGHIKGAVLASWGADLAEKVAMLPTDETVYVYCYSGQTAGQTVALMRMLGIDAISVKSGYNVGATAVEGYEAYVETTANEMTDAGASFDAVLLNEVKAYFNAVEDNANFKIGWDDAQAAVDAGEATVIDIRKAEDFAAGHIVNAVNIPFGAEMDFSALPAGKLIVACYSGQTAGQTTAVLRMLGHDAVSLHFGMKVGWIAEGYPVVTD
jgi:rhodanese-related sulfurtransferase